MTINWIPISTLPKASKRLNKVPMVLVIALAAFAALVIMFGIISHNEKRRGKEKDRGISMDDASVDQITAQIPEGDIKPTSRVVYRDGADAPAGELEAGDNSALAALAARLEALERDYAAQAEELRQAKEAEKLAVANAPLVVDIEAFRSRYRSDDDASKEEDAKIDAGITDDEPLLLPPLEDLEGAGLQKITTADLEAANASGERLPETSRRRDGDRSLQSPGACFRA